VVVVVVAAVPPAVAEAEAPVRLAEGTRPGDSHRHAAHSKRR